MCAPAACTTGDHAGSPLQFIVFSVAYPIQVYIRQAGNLHLYDGTGKLISVDIKSLRHHNHAIFLAKGIISAQVKCDITEFCSIYC
jgi:hypothetical protein